jgi:hypothetical protein
MSRDRRLNHLNQQGQGLMEYVLMLSIVVGVFFTVTKILEDTGVIRKLASPITERYKYTYQYGHPEARGYDDGGPKKHPRIWEGEGSFRLFMTREQ